MKNTIEEEYYLLIPNPFTGEKEEFDLERNSNVALVLRLIRKRENLIEESRSNFNKIQKVRKEKNVDELESRTKELLDKLSSLSKNEDEPEEEFDKRFSYIEDQLEDIQESYPQEVIDLQNKSGKIINDIDRVGIKICLVLLNPVNGIPEEYGSKKDYLEELIADDQDIQDVITFFLSTLSSTMRLRRDKRVQMEKRGKKTGEKGKEK